MNSSTNQFCGTFRIAPVDKPDYIRIGKNGMMVKCRTEGVSGNARARRRQVRQWRRQGLRVTPSSRPWEECVVEDSSIQATSK